MGRPIINLLNQKRAGVSDTLSPTPGRFLLFCCTLREAATASPVITMTTTMGGTWSWNETALLAGSNTATRIFYAFVPEDVTPGTLSFTTTGTPSRQYMMIFEVAGYMGRVLPANFRPVNVNNTTAPASTLLSAPTSALSVCFGICAAVGSTTDLVPASGYDEIGQATAGQTTTFAAVATSPGSAPSQTIGWASGGAAASGNQMIFFEFQGGPIVYASGGHATAAVSNSFQPNYRETLAVFQLGRKNGAVPTTPSCADSLGNNIANLWGGLSNNFASDPDMRMRVVYHTVAALGARTVTSTWPDTASCAVLVVGLAPGLNPNVNTDGAAFSTTGDPAPTLSGAPATDSELLSFAGAAGVAAFTVPSGFTLLSDQTLNADLRVACAYDLAPPAGLTATWASAGGNSLAFVGEAQAAAFAAAKLRLGADIPDALKLGSVDVSKVYLGTSQVW